jgi:predicted lactoylglutathione lyase
MEQRVSLITLGVHDLERSRVFYEALGWHGRTVEQTVFFQAGGLALVLWSRDALAADAGAGTSEEPVGFDGVALAQNVRSRQDVDEIVDVAAGAGGRVTRAPRETSYGGYAGYFADPDGHLWEVAYNPAFSLDEDGLLTLPDFGAS